MPVTLKLRFHFTHNYPGNKTQQNI